jgi:hypothetical protein
VKEIAWSVVTELMQIELAAQTTAAPGVIASYRLDEPRTRGAREEITIRPSERPAVGNRGTVVKADQCNGDAPACTVLLLTVRRH